MPKRINSFDECNGKVENNIENDKFHARNLFRKKGDTAGDFIPPGIPSRGSLPCEEFNAGEIAQKFYDFIQTIAGFWLRSCLGLNIS